MENDVGKEKENLVKNKQAKQTSLISIVSQETKSSIISERIHEMQQMYQLLHIDIFVVVISTIEFGPSSRWIPFRVSK
jgi:hypothetical protein